MHCISLVTLSRLQSPSPVPPPAVGTNDLSVLMWTPTITDKTNQQISGITGFVYSALNSKSVTTLQRPRGSPKDAMKKKSIQSAQKLWLWWRLSDWRKQTDLANITITQAVAARSKFVLRAPLNTIKRKLISCTAWYTFIYQLDYFMLCLWLQLVATTSQHDAHHGRSTRAPRWECCARGVRLVVGLLPVRIQPVPLVRWSLDRLVITRLHGAPWRAGEIDRLFNCTAYLAVFNLTVPERIKIIRVKSVLSACLQLGT